MTASAPLVRQWHRTQQLTTQPDGSVLAEFHRDGTEEVKRWALSFGRHAEVVEPEGLREEMHEEALATAERHCERHQVKPKAGPR